METLCDLDIPRCAATILSMDGQPIATGVVRLLTPPAESRFLTGNPPNRLLDNPNTPALYAEVGTRRYLLDKWYLCAAEHLVEFRSVTDRCYHFVLKEPEY